MTGLVLHVTIGPVQGFIDQARRTRDLWAGSYLLSCLAGAAMVEIDKAPGGRVVFPDVRNDPLFNAIRERIDGNGPIVGSLPNRFKAQVPQDFDIDRVRDAVTGYWRHVADVVRAKILDGVLDHANHEIWDRQVDGFFEIAYVAGPAGGDDAWLDQRKNWRSLVRKPEPGDHCMLNAELQELSGFKRALERKQQDEFWRNVRQAIQDYVAPNGDHLYSTLELRPTERLSALALIKRLFPILKQEHLRDALGFLPTDPAIEMPAPDKPTAIAYWPSLASLAAAPWLVHAGSDQDGARAYLDKIRTAEGPAPANSLAERHSRIQRVRDLGAFGDLDGKFFFDFALDADIKAAARADSDPGVQADSDPGVKRDKRVKEAAIAALKPWLSSLPRELAQGPSPFMALLRMDGDEVGTLLGDTGPGQTKVSAALAAYTAEVQRIVSDQQGVLIYAGGDDVLALFSIDTVLDAVWALRNAYLHAFQKTANCHATTSAGLVLAHMGVPFTRVTQESSRVLDHVAKEKNGRDSLAVSLFKQSGQKVEWCSSFTGMASDGPAILPVMEDFGGIARGVERAERYASFIYRMKERYERFFDAGYEEMLAPVFLAEWLKAQNTDDPSVDLAAERVKLDRLISLCRTDRWPQENQRRDPDQLERKGLDLDGALLVKFLKDNLISPPKASQQRDVA